VKTIGIIGGTGPESTIEYYRLIITAYREQTHDGSYPPILINSIDNKKMLSLVAENKLTELASFLLDELKKLARGGADIGLLAANTSHIVFNDLQRDSPIPLISIVEATCEAAKSMGLKNVGLFGTRYTMQGRFYPDVFLQQGITLSLPDPGEQTIIHDKYLSELVNGVVLPETRQQLLAIAKRLQDQKGIQGLILGGTELSLIFREAAYGGIPFLDTTKIHVKKILEQILS
jgi:aspartate racemase